MGLDMYAFRTKQVLTSPVDFAVDGATEIFYWRKHPDLHGWMNILYVLKGGRDPEFNCAKVVLTSTDLDWLENDVIRPATAHLGFLLRHQPAG